MGALLLAITGIYAVVAFSVSLRTQEIAIRMALGAQRNAHRPARAHFGCEDGVARLRLLACSGRSRFHGWSRSFLFNVSATDPLVYMASVLTMMLLALLASALPATRAASADPIDALHST